jgi:hypothetical protein
MVGFKVFQSFYAACGESVQPLLRCKTNRLAMLTVKSGLDPHMTKLWNMILNRCFVFIFIYDVHALY